MMHYITFWGGPLDGEALVTRTPPETSLFCSDQDFENRIGAKEFYQDYLNSPYRTLKYHRYELEQSPPTKRKIPQNYIYRFHSIV